MANEMIELNDVTKWYGRRGAGAAALSGVALAMTPGAVWGVVGPNGAGKSTLLSLLLGFIRPSLGTVAIGGEAPRDYLREEGAGYLPERFSLPAQWRVGESLRMFAAMERSSDADADRAIAMFGLGPHLGKDAGALSRGLLQRLGLAQAMLAPRSLVVLDEPTEGLDPVWRVRLRDIIADLRSDDRTVIIASHDLSELERVADHAVVLDQGSVRDILDVRASHDPVDYRIRLAAPCADFTNAFPAATEVNPMEYAVRVTAAAELSHRLGGLIALGGVIVAVEPIRRDLEERVRSTLDASDPGGHA